MANDSKGGNALTRLWARLSAHQRRMIAVGALGTVLLLVLYLFVTSSPPSTASRGERQAIVSDLLTGANTRSLGIDGLNNRTRDLEATIKQLQGELSTLSSKLDEEKQRTVDQDELKKQLNDLKRDLIDERRKVDAAGQPDRGAPAGQVAIPGGATAAGPASTVPPENIWSRPAPVAEVPEQVRKGQGQDGKPVAPPVSSIDIRVIGDEGGDADAAQTAAQDIGVYLPAGSIVTGRLITGMEAPTSKSAQSDPFPSLIRVKKDAILPNRYRLDVRECFIIASGYGSLSAERAYLRSEVLSCVRNDGGVIEVPMNAYAVGEDGKVGLRGKVVSKQGQFLAKSLMAGFWSGMSQVFRSVPVPTIQTRPDSSPLYQDVLSTDSLTSGVVQGAGMALDRLAKFYLDMAKDIYPVIEINANRQVSFIVTKGGQLKTISASAKQNGNKNSKPHS